MERSSPKIFKLGSVAESERIMSISIVITIIMITVGSYGAYEKDGVLRLLNVPRHFRQTKELRENGGYIEQCRATNLRKEQLGQVNVFAFLDPSWYYSYRQAIMLASLKNRLEKSGFSNIFFFMVTPPSDLLEDSTENNIEIKAWREISKNTQEFEYSLDSVETLFGDMKKKKKGIILLEDTSELGIWKSFHASKDEVVIIDRCGKVTYQIIVPWSILHFPYVKAAILSTYKEDPCGPCYGQSSTVRDSMDYEEYLLKTINSDETKVDENLDKQTDRVFSEYLETIKVSSEELKQVEDDNNTSTIASFNADVHESTAHDITTEVSTIRTTENMKNNDNVRDIFFTDKNIEVTPEVPLEQEQTPIPTIISNLTTTEVYSERQDCIFSNKHVNGNNDVSFTNTDLRKHNKNFQNESNISLENMRMEEHEAVNESAKAEELQSSNDESIPLRIILYAPHLHEENGTLTKYTHLVLNTGSLNYHDHFNSKSTTSDQEVPYPTALKKSDSEILNDRTLAEYVHNVNESPGVYGEVADYWQTIDGNELNNKNENAELTDYDYVTAEDTGSIINNIFNNERPSDIDAIDSDMNIKNNNNLDDFTQQRLIEHYSKLLTWIYYIVYLFVISSGSLASSESKLLLLLVVVVLEVLLSESVSESVSLLSLELELLDNLYKT
ncbi:unnamed protein product [Heterotrigona itama]|uniref:Selenoprotein P N-terminal domain-containing protein n=1 Tax=Heterotrigona itama TaxID=395501 RepID=A0A6V7HF86_9HYME|nr:unnamed protein product [Heterotrigona itama]